MDHSDLLTCQDAAPACQQKYKKGLNVVSDATLWERMGIYHCLIHTEGRKPSTVYYNDHVTAVESPRDIALSCLHKLANMISYWNE